MSKELEQFKLSAKAKDWPLAIKQCNGLNMPEMLAGLDSLGAQGLDEFDAQLASVGLPFGVARMNWAVEVVRTRAIPAGAAPGDLLSTGQVQHARDFLSKAKALAPAKRKRLKLTLFWTEEAKNETVSSALVQKAQDLLKSNGDKFILDIDHRRNVIAFKRTIDFEVDGCGDSGVENIKTLVKQSGVCPSDRLAVIFCKPFSTAGLSNDTHGMHCAPCVLINVTSLSFDNGTLLHEVGHGAGLGHEPDNSNLMSYGTNRTKINPVQLARFAKAFFCSA